MRSVPVLNNNISITDERRSASDGIRRQVGEVELMKEREQRLMRDLEAAMVRIKTLEEAVESERASHLESKFNSEIIQVANQTYTLLNKNIFYRVGFGNFDGTKLARVAVALRNYRYS